MSNGTTSARLLCACQNHFGEFYQLHQPHISGKINLSSTSFGRRAEKKIIRSYIDDAVNNSMRLNFNANKSDRARLEFLIHFIYYFKVNIYTSIEQSIILFIYFFFFGRTIVKCITLKMKAKNTIKSNVDSFCFRLLCAFTHFIHKRDGINVYIMKYSLQAIDHFIIHLSRHSLFSSLYVFRFFARSVLSSKHCALMVAHECSQSRAVWCTARLRRV